MKTFLKVILVLLLVVLAIKLLPAVLALGCLLAGAIALVAGVGVALLVVVACVVFGLAVLLSPLWLPVLAVVGLVALLRGGNNKAAA